MPNLIQTQPSAAQIPPTQYAVGGLFMPNLIHTQPSAGRVAWVRLPCRLGMNHPPTAVGGICGRDGA